MGILRVPIDKWKMEEWKQWKAAKFHTWFDEETCEILDQQVLSKLSFLKELNSFLRIHWRLSTTLKTSQKLHEVMFFWYVKVCIFSKCIQYTIHWDKTQMLKKIPSDKINSTKNALFFLSQAPTHHNVTFILRFLYELKHKVRLSKTVYGIFHFRFRFIFIKVSIFVQQNAWTFWL